MKMNMIHFKSCVIVFFIIVSILKDIHAVSSEHCEKILYSRIYLGLALPLDGKILYLYQLFPKHDSTFNPILANYILLLTEFKIKDYEEYIAEEMIIKIFCRKFEVSVHWKYFLESPPKIITRRAKFKLGEITHQNIKHVKQLNRSFIPVFYDDEFYEYIIATGEISKLAYYNDIAVGAICCEIEEDIVRRIYIMTLGCLSQYRRLGIGSIMMEYILNYAENDGTFDSVYLHTQTNNDVAIKFYKKFGFKIVHTIEKYYTDIEPTSAHVMEKQVRRKTLNGKSDHHSVNNKNDL